MQGSVRKKGATWSYRVEFGIVAGKHNQIERSGFKTKRFLLKRYMMSL